MVTERPLPLLDADFAASGAGPAAMIRHHRDVLLGAVAILIAGLVLDVNGADGVTVGPGSGGTLPTICLSRVWFDLPCALCGMTRGVVHTLHGRWEAAWNIHRLAIPFVLLTVWQIPYRWWVIARLRAGGKDLRTPRWLWGLAVTVLMINWLI